MQYLTLLATAGLIIVACFLQLVSIFIAILRLNHSATFSRTARQAGPSAGISVIRPVCGLENFVEATLRSSFQLEYPRYEIIFCVADARDPVIPLLRRLMAAYPAIDARLLIGNDPVSANPKLNNLVKGWREARYDWILMADSNVMMPRDQLQLMLREWRADTGLVCSPPVGVAPSNPWAELECGFLNTYQARWQSCAAGVGWGFAQGKAMLWRRDLLEQAGGVEALGSEIAEDAAATKIVRGLGLHVRMVGRPFAQPLGYRSFSDVWRRQLRWARLRRTTFKSFFIPELFSGLFAPLLLTIAWAWMAGFPVVVAGVALAMAWYAAEAWLAYRAGWPVSLQSIPIWLLRDALLPALWICAWAGDEFVWRGHAMSCADSGEVAALALASRSNVGD